MNWIYNHAIHEGTITSCEIAEPTEHNTKQDAINEYNAQRKFYHSIGYKIWYAKIISPNGITSTLEENPYNK